MESSKLPRKELNRAQERDFLFDSIRFDNFVASPEEIVRQKLISYLIDELLFPKELMAIEKAISSLPHLSFEEKCASPKRRADIICFARDIHKDHALYPLLLIECKAGALKSGMRRQLMGYNNYVKAHFVALVGNAELFFGWYDKKMGKYTWTDFIPPFSSLINATSF